MFIDMSHDKEVFYIIDLNSKTSFFFLIKKKTYFYFLLVWGLEVVENLNCIDIFPYDAAFPFISFLYSSGSLQGG